MDKADRLAAAQRLAFDTFDSFDDFPVHASHQYLGRYWLGGVTDKDLRRSNDHEAVIERCILMATDPGDLVLDPTCGSGTTAYVAEQWGRRWITIDTSRVALALARARIMGARYPYLPARRRATARSRKPRSRAPLRARRPVHGNIRQGFVYERVPHITLKSIANNAEIDVIWEKLQAKLEPLREQLNAALKQDMGGMGNPARGRRRLAGRRRRSCTPNGGKARIARQKEIDASIAAKAEFEYLYDKPYEDKKKVRVAGPFTVESLTPHRVLAVDENDELIDALKAKTARRRRQEILRPDDPGKPQDRRRPAGAQGRQDRLHLAHALARRSGLRRRPVYGRRRRRRSAPPSSSARSSAPSRVPIWSRPPARPATPVSTC